jgi:hypothetical protein
MLFTNPSQSDRGQLWLRQALGLDESVGEAMQKNKSSNTRLDLNTHLVWLMEQLTAKSDPVSLEQLQRFTRNPEIMMPPGCLAAVKIPLGNGLDAVATGTGKLIADVDGVYLTAWSEHSSPIEAEFTERIVKVGLGGMKVITSEGAMNLLGLHDGYPVVQLRRTEGKQKEDVVKRNGAIICGPEVVSVTSTGDGCDSALVYTKKSQSSVDVFLWRGGKPQRCGWFTSMKSSPIHFVCFEKTGLLMQKGRSLCNVIDGSAQPHELVPNCSAVIAQTAEFVSDGLKDSTLYPSAKDRTVGVQPEERIGRFDGACMGAVSLIVKAKTDRNVRTYAFLQGRRHHQVGWSIARFKRGHENDITPMERLPAFNAVSKPMMDESGKCFYWGVCEDWLYRMEMPLDIYRVVT